MPANSGALKSNNKELLPSRRKEALFYLPDAIFTWAEQTVCWVLDFFRKLYQRSEQDASALVEPLRLDELMKARIGSLSKGERKRVAMVLLPDVIESVSIFARVKCSKVGDLFLISN